jgi:hypothetical protein
MNRKSTQVLFMGGPMDGKRLMVPDDEQHFRSPITQELVPVYKPVSTWIIDKRFEYKREILCHGGEHPPKYYSVFIPKDSVKNVIELLIEGYK